MALLNRFNWLEEGQLLGCVYPRNEADLADLAALGVTLLVNLHETPHLGADLARHGLSELHLPVRDFTAPTPYQLERGIRAIEETLAEGGRVAVHCAAGIGRTGTLLACYLVHQGLNAQEAIARVRAARPGSVEVTAQRRAVHEYERQLRGNG